MRFNEWITQNKEEEEYSEEDLLENQLDQWVTRLMGLLQSAPQQTKQKLLEKVIANIKTKI